MSHLVNQGAGAAPITPTGSPFTWQNTNPYPVAVIISAGTVTTVEFSRDGVTFFAVGLLAGQYHLSPGDRIRVTYAVAPTMTMVPI